MPASSSDFTSLQQSGETIATQWPPLVRAIQSLRLLFEQKVATGTEPNDVLVGLILGEGVNRNEWRIRVNGGDLRLEENTGTEATPVWTLRNTFVAGSGLGNLDASIITTGQFADARIAVTNVTQHQGSIDHGSISGLGDDDHTHYILVNATRAFTATPNVNGNDIFHEGNDGAGSGLDADLLDGVQGSAYSQKAVNEEFTAAKGVTELTPTISSGAITFNFAGSNQHEVSLTENITSITISNTSIPGTHVIVLTQDVTGGRTVTGWPSAVKWPAGSAPVITAAANARDTITFLVMGNGDILGVHTANFS